MNDDVPNMPRQPRELQPIVDSSDVPFAYHEGGPQSPPELMWNKTQHKDRAFGVGGVFSPPGVDSSYKQPGALRSAGEGKFNPEQRKVEVWTPESENTVDLLDDFGANHKRDLEKL